MYQMEKGRGGSVPSLSLSASPWQRFAMAAQADSTAAAPGLPGARGSGGAGGERNAATASESVREEGSGGRRHGDDEMIREKRKRFGLRLKRNPSLPTQLLVYCIQVRSGRWARQQVCVIPPAGLGRAVRRHATRTSHVPRRPILAAAPSRRR